MQRSTGVMTFARHKSSFGSPRFQTSHYLLLLRQMSWNRNHEAIEQRRQNLSGPWYDSVAEAFAANRRKH